MKKFLCVVGILFLIFCGLLIYNEKIFHISALEIEEETMEIDSLYIYGRRLNIEGEYNLSENADLVLYNGEFISYPINIKDNRFNLSEYVNDGLYLDVINNGKYYMFIRTKYLDGDVEKYRYYGIENTTEYKETLYYTMSNYDKRIIIKSDDRYKTLVMNVSNNRNKDVYDIVIDPGHGGRDPGACRYDYCETDFTMDISLKLKEILEGAGIRVKLTYEQGQLDENTKLNEYGVHGRAVIPKEVNAKYVFSIHLNSGKDQNVNGFEIYAPNNANYDFAKYIADNIVAATGSQYSNNTKNKVLDGVYSRSFTDKDISDALKDYQSNKLNPYVITNNTNYYYMIRETGGIITGAYVDNRNEKILENPYVKTNVGVESYILELGFLSNKKDLNNIINNKTKYIEAIANSIKELYFNNY